MNINQLDKKQFDQTGLHKIKNCDNSERKADVIFVHGLMGHAITTWHPEEKCDQECWPFWLGDEKEFKTVGIWSFGYKANPVGNAMSIYEQANSLLNILLNEAKDYGIGKNPLMFITHSLGGLVIKEMLNNANTINSTPDKKKIIQQIKGIVFIASPHLGSDLANIINILTFSQSSIIVKQLKANNDDTSLTKTNEWFIQNFSSLGITCKVFYETESTSIPIQLPLGIKLHLGKVVKRDSASLSIPGVDSIPVTANHLNIAKPQLISKSQEGNIIGDTIYNTVYKSVRTFIGECLNSNP
ncbi:esterase/lipase family protein [Dolichospermum heterosporum]|uniref:Lipase n=1 Tax=Dolichospermum heterosporum TAC447 TaxID=747523 RepID=A0ABY5LYE7_9CYAN|nr:putative lipase [Dolichospermum heterosporum]UUO16009.1 putative lipase [Dolichospermum heterosporum TAC447]